MAIVSLSLTAGSFMMTFMVYCPKAQLFPIPPKGVQQNVQTRDTYPLSDCVE